MSELGIFIDESGVFDLDKTFNNNLKDFYIVSFVFHNKTMEINTEIQNFEKFLIENGFQS